jgi:hypothetical protein
MRAYARMWIAALVACSVVCRCGGDAGPGPESAADEKPGKAPLTDFPSAAAILPPAPLAVAWADVDSIRQGPASPLLDELGGNVKVPGGSDTSFFRDNLDSIHRLAGGIWVTMSGPSLLVVLEGTFTTEEMFGAAREWASSKQAKALPCKVRGRPCLRVGDTVLVEAGPGTFINGPQGLVSRTLDLMSNKNVGSSLTPELAYLAGHTIKKQTPFVVAGVVPPTSTDWLTKKNLPSVVGSRFLFAVQTPDAIHMRLGLLPGKPIKPIWFAQEVNTFLVRAAKDPGITKLGLGDWVEGLDVELLNKGIVIKGRLEGEKLIEIVKGGT